MDIAKIVKSIISHEGLSQKQAAKIMNISEQYLSDMISGRRRVTPEIAELICCKICTEDPDDLRADFALHGAIQDGWNVAAINKKALQYLKETTHD